MMKLWVAALCAAVAGCATTEVKTTWKDPQFTGPPAARILVIGVASEDANRRVFEDGFSAALAAAGTKADASYVTIPDGAKMTKARLHEVVGQSGANAVLLTRALRVTQYVPTPMPPMTNTYMGGMYAGYGSWTSLEPTMDPYAMVTLESTLWDAKTEKPIWKGTSDTVLTKDVSGMSASLAKALVAKMQADGVIAR